MNADRAHARDPYDDENVLFAQLESLLLVAGGPVPIAALGSAVNLSTPRTALAVRALQMRMQGGIRVQIHDGQAQLVSAPEYAEVVHRFLGTTRPTPISRAAMETLTVIAYRQPVTRGEIESTRGANSDRAVQTLVARGLVEEAGCRPTLGRPMQYVTTLGFLEYFGLSSLNDLPPLPNDDAAQVPPAQLGLRTAEDGLERPRV